MTMSVDQARETLAVYYEHERHLEAVKVLLEQRGRDAVPELVGYFESLGDWVSETEADMLAEVVGHLGPDAAPVLLAAVAHRPRKARRVAAAHFCSLAVPPADEITKAIDQGIAAGPTVAPSFIEMAAAYDFSTFGPKLWDLLEHKSKPLREAASVAVGKRAADAVERAAPMLSDKKAAARQTAARILGACGSAEALALLHERLEQESSANVREEILAQLKQAGVALPSAEAPAGPAAARDRVAGLAAKIKVSLPKWIKLDAMPPVHYRDGTQLAREEVAWLLFRQSRQKQCQPDADVAALYEAIDPAGSAEFALQLLLACLKKPDNDRTWAYVTAALLGDDRIVPLLSSHMKKAADGFKVKWGQWAVDALILHGSDAGLTAVHAFAARYKDHSRQKYYKIGRHAHQAVLAVAKQRNLSLDELADRAVPWLGFRPGQKRVVDAGKRQIEVTIGADLKFAFRDAATGRRVASIPKAAGAEVQAELKGAAKLVREVVKTQTDRLERMMCDQRRWEVEPWRERFLLHPVLLRLAGSLVWGLYDDENRPIRTFRPLEDHTLTDGNDQPVEMLGKHSVGIAHPLDLKAPERQAWLRHLADYEIATPFAQMDRPITLPAEEDSRAKQVTRFAQSQVNAMTFHGRAERLGWHRGPFRGKAAVSTCCKRFPSHEINAFLDIMEDGSEFGDPRAEVALGNLVFARQAEFDPQRWDAWPEEDPSLELGEVPPIVFSEAIYDVSRMAGV